MEFLQTCKKAFDTVNHQVLLPKLYHHGIRGFQMIGSNPLCLTLSVFINRWFWPWCCCYKFYRHSRICSQTSPFLLYINDLNQAITFCKTRHFVDGTNLLCMSNSIRKLNKLVNADLKHQGNWLTVNKTSLSIKRSWDGDL